MSLRPHALEPVPEETARIARAAFPAGTTYTRMRDHIEAIYRDEDFAHLFSVRGQPAEAPWRLALVTIFQFAEDLSDRQAADAVRARIDWKYALNLDLADPGFDHTVLSEFRSRLVAGGAERLLFDVLLQRFRELALLKARGRQRTDSTHVLAAVRALNRLELVRETMRHVLEVLAEVAPGWRSVHARGDWVKRYQRQSDEWRLPKGKAAQQELAEQIGRDGMDVLTAVSATDAPAWLPEVPAMEMLRRIWLQNYVQTEAGVRFRTAADGVPPSIRFISSPHDADAHLGKKGSLCWIGYKVSLTETCEDDLPNLITHVETTAAPTADGEVTPKVHEDLQAKALLPTIHLVDTGFLDAELIATSKRDYDVNLLGPTRPDVKWQAKEGTGFDAQRFVIDWERQQATCPEGKTSIGWTPAIDKRTNHVIKIKFSGKDCRVCASRDRCMRSTKKYARRTVTIRTREHYEALQARRAEETTPAYATEYCRRAGIEGTISQGVRRCGMRRSRYVGRAKTHLDHVFTAAAINYVRVANWLADVPRAETRHSKFVTLMTGPITA
jgi:transposase